jgi:hypothetical protein
MFTCPFVKKNVCSPRFDHLDMKFFEELEANGLVFDEVVESGRELLPPSPPPLTELFPEMRIAVYNIKHA